MDCQLVGDIKKKTGEKKHTNGESPCGNVKGQDSGKA